MTRFLIALVLSLCAFGCGSGGTKKTTTSTSPAGGTVGTAPRARVAGVFKVRVVKIGSLPAALQDPAASALDDRRLALLGGLNAADSSVSSVTLVEGGSASGGGSLPIAQHDAASAALGRYVYVFGGGGATSQFDHILRYDPATRQVIQVGKLPIPASDVGATSVGDSAYVVGGYDGTRWLTTILAWRPGAAPRVVGRLPVGLRYAAVTSIGGHVIIAGGTTPTGVSAAILSFDPASGRVSRLGQLPVALTHAAAAPVGGHVLVIGGRRSSGGGQTSSILALDPHSGMVSRAGRLNVPLSDAGAVALDGGVTVAGGSDGSVTQRSIYALRAL